jgi:hypothetical protein
MEDLEFDGNMCRILKWIFEEYRVRVRIGFIWIGIRANDRPVVLNFRVFLNKVSLPKFDNSVLVTMRMSCNRHSFRDRSLSRQKSFETEASQLVLTCNERECCDVSRIFDLVSEFNVSAKKKQVV